MALRGICFLLEVGFGDRTLEKLMALESRGLRVTGALRKQNHLWVRLAATTSTQRVAEAVGPSVPVSTDALVPLLEAAPGTDWLVRAVGSPDLVERCYGRVLTLVKEIADEIGETDLIELRLSDGEPTVLDMRLSTGMGTRLETRKVRILELAEKLGLSMLVQPLSMLGSPRAWHALTSTAPWSPRN